MIDIQIKEAKRIANKYGYEQVIILAQKSLSNKNWVNGRLVTYNKDKSKCKYLGKIADILAMSLRCYYWNEKSTREHYSIYLKRIKEEKRRPNDNPK